MSTSSTPPPSTPEEPDARAAADSPTAATQSPADPVATPQWAPPPQPQSVPPQPSPYPFTPIVREPWLNPAKRRTAGLLGAALALLLLGVGFVVGAAAGNRDDGREHSRMQQGYPRMQPGGGNRGNRFDPGFAPGNGRGHPRNPNQPAAPTDVPSPTTSSHS